MIDLSVKIIPTEHTIHLTDVDHTTVTVAQLKQRLYDTHRGQTQLGLPPPHLQRIIHQARELEDHYTLKDCCITSNQSLLLHIVWRSASSITTMMTAAQQQQQTKQDVIKSSMLNNNNNNNNNDNVSAPDDNKDRHHRHNDHNDNRHEDEDSDDESNDEDEDDLDDDNEEDFDQTSSNNNNSVSSSNVKVELDSSNGNKEENIKKLKRGCYVRRACSNCRLAHAACDNGRPCKRCVEMGKEDSCVDAERKKTRKRTFKPKPSIWDNVEAPAMFASMSDFMPLLGQLQLAAPEEAVTAAEQQSTTTANQQQQQQSDNKQQQQKKKMAAKDATAAKKPTSRRKKDSSTEPSTATKPTRRRSTTAASSSKTSTATGRNTRSRKRSEPAVVDHDDNNDNDMGQVISLESSELNTYIEMNRQLDEDFDFISRTVEATRLQQQQLGGEIPSSIPVDHAGDTTASHVMMTDGLMSEAPNLLENELYRHHFNILNTFGEHAGGIDSPNASSETLAHNNNNVVGEDFDADKSIEICQFLSDDIITPISAGPHFSPFCETGSTTAAVATCNDSEVSAQSFLASSGGDHDQSLLNMMDISPTTGGHGHTPFGSSSSAILIDQPLYSQDSSSGCMLSSPPTSPIAMTTPLAMPFPMVEQPAVAVAQELFTPTEHDVTVMANANGHMLQRFLVAYMHQSKELRDLRTVVKELQHVVLASATTSAAQSATA